MKARLVAANRWLAELHYRSQAFRKLWLYVWVLFGVAAFYVAFAFMGLIPA